MAYIQSRSSPSYRLELISVSLLSYLQFSNKGQIVPFSFCTKLKVVFLKWQPTFSNGSKDAIWAAVYARRDLPCLWIPGCRSAGPPPQCSPSSDSCVDDSSDQLFTPEIRRRLPGTKAVALRQSKGSKLLPHALPGLRVRVIVRLLRSCRVVSIQEALISHSSLLLPVTSTHHVAF